MQLWFNLAIVFLIVLLPTILSFCVSSTRTLRLSCQRALLTMKREVEDESGPVGKKLKLEPATTLARPPPVSTFDMTRCRLLTKANSALVSSGECVVLHMSRDQRVEDNYAMIYAQGLAMSRNVPLRVVFNLVPKFGKATLRQYHFMMTGLKEVEQSLRAKGIPFHLTMGDPVKEISSFAKSHKALALVCDFSPLRVPLGWSCEIAYALDGDKSEIPVIQVDAHNIVPVWVASNKLEYGARTLRSKLDKLLPRYLKDDMVSIAHNSDYSRKGDILASCDPVDWDKAMTTVEVDRTVKDVKWLKPGTAGGWSTLNDFCEKRLKVYADKRNDPNIHAASEMSPYFHFGQFSVQRAILHVKSLRTHNSSAASFQEEAVVRRELSDNFCFYNPKYDSLDGCYDWALNSLKDHWNDKREYLYSQSQLDKAQTHDDLWNAAQIQLTTHGKMHGFLRMYWAKKILEWTENPSEALRIALYLNDRYSLDGNDPNGYVGCMWSIGGIHDQGWAERAIFGKIRYMNYKGCERKFKVKEFVAKYPPASENARAAIAKDGQKSVTSFFNVKKEKK